MASAGRKGKTSTDINVSTCALSLYVHPAETMSMYILEYIIHSFNTQRELCGLVWHQYCLFYAVAAAPTVLASIWNRPRVRWGPVLRWNQARGRLFHYLPVWVSNTDHYITGGLQSTAQMVAFIWNWSWVIHSDSKQAHAGSKRILYRSEKCVLTEKKANYT